MRRFFYITIPVLACIVVSCSKESTNVQLEKPEDTLQKEEPARTITFSATIDVSKDTKAALNDHAIEWSDDSNKDVIAVANDLNGAIQSCIVTRDPGNYTVGKFDVVEVVGAENYYALYTGSSDFSGIAFDKDTKTFYGTSVGELTSNRKQYSVGSLSGAPLSMAGKASSSSSNISFRPCLALAKFRLGEDSVKSKHDGTYSGVRGLNFYQDPSASYDGGAPYTSGDYRVDLSGENIVITTDDNKNRRNYREIATAELLSKDTDYYFCFIPAGEINGFKLDLLGFKSDLSVSNAAQYTMTLNQSLTIDPGDYFDFGTIDPVKAKKSEADFSDYAIKTMSDWDSVSASDSSSDPADNNIELKVTYDKYYFYIYTKRTYTDDVWNNQGYFYYCLDTDGNPTNGTDANAKGQMSDIVFFVKPYGGTSASPEFNTTPSCTVTYSGRTLTPTCIGRYDANTIETSLKISRKSLGLFKGDTVKILSWGNKGNQKTLVESGILLSN